MDAIILFDETVSRELTEHNMVAKKAGFNQQRKNTLPTMTLRNVHYACTWACPTSSERTRVLQQAGRQTKYK